jgi:hypothetical protein
MKYECPCCGYFTLPVQRKEAIGFICPVCFWENDVFTVKDDEMSVCNNCMTLSEGRANFRMLGACAENMLPHVRKPTREEKMGTNKRD